MAHWFYLVLLLDLHSICRVSMFPVDVDDHKLDIGQTTSSTVSLERTDHRCQRSITYEEIQRLLAQSPCAADHEDHEPMDRWRMKRNRDSDTSNHIYALQTTVNDHRTIIDDHRTMIHYLMNNTVNITQLNQHFAEQHMRSRPIWQSWRDVSLVLLIFISVFILSYLLVTLFKPLDLLTSFLLRRQQAKKQVHIKKSQKKNSVVQRQPSEMELDTMSTTLERNYLRY